MPLVMTSLRAWLVQFGFRFTAVTGHEVFEDFSLTTNASKKRILLWCFYLESD